MKGRLIYIDVLRGLCIFVVVYSHLLLFCTEKYATSTLIDFLRSFFLGEFFFISGFVVYKQQCWTINNFIEFLKKKCKTILIPTLVCGTIYMITHDIPITNAWMSDSKCGYWFTYTLFLMFIIYGIVSLFLKSIKKEYVIFIVWIGLALCSVVVHKLPIVAGKIQDFLTIEGLTYHFPYFVLGVICKRYIDFFHLKIIGTNIGKLTIFTVVIAGYYIPIPLFIKNIAVVLFVYYITALICNGNITQGGGKSISFYWEAYFRNLFFALVYAFQITGLYRSLSKNV